MRPLDSPFRRSALLSVLCGLLFLTSSCDPSVDPFARDGAPYFSIVGVLDAGRDTQSVRVASLRDSVALGAPPVPFNATVTSEHPASGRRTTWRDSLFRFRFVRDEDLQRDRFVHNAWTTADFRPNETYRFTVTDPNGAASSATVTLPDTFPAPELIPPGMFSPAWDIRVHGVDRLADVIIIYRVERSSGEIQTVEISHIADTVRLSPQEYSIDVVVGEEPLSGTVLSSDVRIVAAGPEWPESGDLDDEMLVAPGAVSNVEDGLGYLAGVTSKTVPMIE